MKVWLDIMKQESERFAGNVLYELTARRRFLMILASFLAVATVGIVGISRSEMLAIFLDSYRNLPAGLALMLLGTLCAVCAGLIIMRQMRRLLQSSFSEDTHEFIPEEERPDMGIYIGSVRFRPIVFISLLILIGSMSFGLGYALCLDELSSFAVMISVLSALCMLCAFFFIAKGVINARSNRVIGVICACLFIGATIGCLMRLPPVLRDMSSDKLNQVTAVVVSVDRVKSRLTSPGVEEVVVRSTSGENIALRCPLNAREELVPGSRYTFKYRRNTKLCEEWIDAPPVGELIIPDLNIGQ